MPTDEFKLQTAGLRALGGQRVWSLMISLFGDLAREEGQSIDGPLLSTIMQGLDVKPEASRVALHRLRKDGWLTSEKTGRISRHSLTAEGRAQSDAASPRIYADPDALPDNWQIVILPDNSPASETVLTAEGFALIAPRIAVGPLSAKAPPAALSLTGGTVPDWLIRQAQPKALQPQYAELLKTLNAVQFSLPSNANLSPHDTAVLRCLIVHNWRRLVLKHPMLPAPLIDPNAPNHQCHLRVRDLLHRFPRPALADLEKHRSAA